jgi:tetraspanin-18
VSYIKKKTSKMCSCKGLAVLILVLVNFVFAAAGILMLAFGIAAAADPDSVAKTLSYTEDITKKSSQAGFDLANIIQKSSVFLIVMGSIVALLGLFGCIGACCKVKWMLGIYITVLILVLLAEIALIIFATVFPDQFETESLPAMVKSLAKFKQDGMFNGTSFMMPFGETELAWSSMQFELGCCGAKDYRDYQNVTFDKSSPRYSMAKVPVSCCKLTKGAGKVATSQDEFKNLDDCQRASPDAANINEMGCYEALENVVKTYGRVAIGIAAAIIGIEVILILLAAWICRSIDVTTKSQSI